jgi:O-antigen/teichoic acid export membrane protein
MSLPSKIKSASGFKLDLAANFSGVGWSVLIQIACVPLYLKFLGIEAYGLVGFYLMLQAILQVLDFGLSPTMNREMARYSVQPEKAAEARDLVRTLEVGYWLIGIAIGAIILAAAPVIAADWIKVGSIPIRTVSHAVMLMGLLSVFQWPLTLYQGALMGLRRQLLFNSFKITMVTLSQGGAVLVLWLISPTIGAFLVWQAAVSCVQVLLIAVLLWKRLPPADRPARFDLRVVRKIWHFAAGMSGITLIGLALSQIDKVVVSKLLPLRMFGYYTLAWSVANGLLAISGAVFNAIFPRMSAQAVIGDENGIRQSYHYGSQVMAVLILPFAAVLSLFSFDILRLWTRSSQTATAAAPILSVLVIGSAVNALLFLPYALQLAFGWTKLSLFAGLLSMVIVIPVMFPMTEYFGPVGAATVWAVLNILNILVVVPIMHRRLLPGEVWGYFGDIGLPLVSAVGLAVLCRLIFRDLSSPVMTLAALSIAWLGSLVVAVLAAPRVRSWALAQVLNAKLQYVRGVESFS